MKHSQIGNGVISYGPCTPWGDDAMPRGHCGWYPFHGLVRFVLVIMLKEMTTIFFENFICPLKSLNYFMKKKRTEESLSCFVKIPSPWQKPVFLIRVKN